MFLTRAEPAAVGMSPIGGFIDPCFEPDDWGLAVDCGAPARYSPRVPISPGLYAEVRVKRARRLAFGESVTVTQPGILAFDGDRTLAVDDAHPAVSEIRRDGPWIIDARRVMERASREGRLAGPG